MPLLANDNIRTAALAYLASLLGVQMPVLERFRQVNPNLYAALVAAAVAEMTKAPMQDHAEDKSTNGNYV